MTASLDKDAAERAHATMKALIDEATDRDLQCGVVAQITGFPTMNEWVRLDDGHHPLLGVLHLIIKTNGNQNGLGLRFRVCDLTVHGQKIVDAFTTWVLAAACEKHTHETMPKLTGGEP